jgi:hypothetical protein
MPNPSSTFTPCACGHRHDPQRHDLARVSGHLICSHPRCWPAVVIAARIGEQLRAFQETDP